MNLAHSRRQGATHDQPHDDFRAFDSAALRIVRDGQFGQLPGILFEELEKLHVPIRVVETGALAADLVREPARTDDRDLEVFGIAQDRLAQRTPEREAPPRSRDRKLQHSDLQRHDGHGPLLLVRQHDGQRRENAVVQTLRLKERQIKLVGDQPVRDVLRERRMTLDGRKRSRSTAFVSHRERIGETQRKVRIVVEKERRHVIVVDIEEHVRCLLLEPGTHRGEALEYRRPDRIAGLLRVDRKGDRRRM